jgi:isopenicillin N synthase-like dioxygenase
MTTTSYSTDTATTSTTTTTTNIMMDTSGDCVDHIPLIDLSLPETIIVQQLMTAFTTIGFATLIHHGVSSTLRHQVFQASQSFFQLPLCQKSKYQYQHPTSNRGYIPSGSEHHDNHLEEGRSPTMDGKETMDIGWDAEVGYTNQWPLELSEQSFKNVLLEYFDTMDALQLRLMRYVAIGLGVHPPEYLTMRCNGRHENLRLLHYPSSTSATSDSFVRGNAHTDFGTLTLLVQDQVGGLKVQRTNGTWIDVKPMDDSIIVNVGDVRNFQRVIGCLHADSSLLYVSVAHTFKSGCCCCRRC